MVSRKIDAYEKQNWNTRYKKKKKLGPKQTFFVNII